MKRLSIVFIALVLALVACGGSDDAAGNGDLGPGDATHGQDIYQTSCMGCHGLEGEGVEGLGKPWVNSDFIQARTDAELLQFLIEGRPSDHPENSTGIAMMPRGGNPNLTDADLMDLIAYMRTLNP